MTADTSADADGKMSPAWYQTFDSRIVAHMTDDPNGRYVRASDYETLQSELDGLSQQLAEARNALGLISGSTSNQHIISIATTALKSTTGEDSNG